MSRTPSESDRRAQAVERPKQPESVQVSPDLAAALIAQGRDLERQALVAHLDAVSDSFRARMEKLRARRPDSPMVEVHATQWRLLVVLAEDIHEGEHVPRVATASWIPLEVKAGADLATVTETSRVAAELAKEGPEPPKEGDGG